MNSSLLERQSAPVASLPDAAPVVSILDQIIRETPGATAFTNEAVEQYKDAVLRNTLDRYPRKYRLLRHFHKPMNWLQTCLNVVGLLSIIVSVIAAMATVLTLVVTAVQFLTGTTDPVWSPLPWAVGFVGSFASAVACYYLDQQLSGITTITDMVTWSVVKPEGLTPRRAGLVMADLRRRLEEYGKPEFQLHQMGVDPFLQVKFTDYQTGRTSKRFFYGWDLGVVLRQTNGRVHHTDETLN